MDALRSGQEKNNTPFQIKTNLDAGQRNSILLAIPLKCWASKFKRANASDELRWTLGAANNCNNI